MIIITRTKWFLQYQYLKLLVTVIAHYEGDIIVIPLILGLDLCNNMISPKYVG